MTNLMLNCLFLTFSNVRLFQLYGTDYSKSHKVATQANLRKTRGMQMSIFWPDICMFSNWTLTFQTFDSVATLWDWLYTIWIKLAKVTNVISSLAKLIHIATYLGYRKFRKVATQANVRKTPHMQMSINKLTYPCSNFEG